MVKVEKRSTGGVLRTLAQYQYNALNWRVIKRDNTNLNTDGDLDEQTVLYYNERWQLLREEIYDNWTEASPGSVDRHANLIYGFPGDHIDQVVTRVYNDGTTTRPYYHLHDPQYSTVVVLDTAAKIVERIDYSAFGFARHHHFGDVNGDGSGPDRATITTISTSVPPLGTSPVIGDTYYHAEADLDRNGTVNSTDVLLASITLKTALAAGEISDRSTCSNDIGYCGYVYNADSALYTVRFRDYHPQRGRWLQRDPADYMDGNNLYGYVTENPIGWIDPSGLFEQFSDKFYSSDPTQFGSTGGAVGLGASWYGWIGVNVRINGHKLIAIGRPLDRSFWRSTSSMFLYDRAKLSRHWRLDFGPVPGKIGSSYHYNQKGLHGAGIVPHTNHMPAGSGAIWAGRLAKVARVLGPVGAVLGLYGSVSNIVNADDTTQAILEEGAGWAGAVGGAWAGAKVGAMSLAWAGPVGMGIGAIVGGVGGAILGDKLGRYAVSPPTVNRYDNWLDNKLAQWGIIG